MPAARPTGRRSRWRRLVRAKALGLLIALISGSVLTSCDTSQRDFERAQTEGTQAAYEKFLLDHPSGELANKARHQLEELAHAAARKSNTIESLEAFLVRFPESRHRTETTAELKKKCEKRDWDSAVAANSISEFEQFLTEYPVSVHAADAAKRIMILRRPPMDEVSLGAFPARISAESICVSPDARRLAFRVEGNLGAGRVRLGDMGTSRQYVVVDGKQGRATKQVGGLKFSWDGKHFAYWTRDAIFDPGGHRFGRDGGRWAFVVDGRECKKYDKILRSSFRFSDDGKRHGFVAVDRKGVHIVVNGRELAETYRSAGYLAFSRDGKRFAKTVQGPKGGLMVVVDQDKGREYQKIGRLLFSPDGSRLAYVGSSRGRHHVVLEGVEGPSFDAIREMVFSPDGERFAYSAKKGSSIEVVLDGESQGKFDVAQGLGFSPDGRHFGFGARTGLHDLTVIDGKKKKGQGAPFFGAQGRFAYVSVSGNRVVFNDSESRGFESVHPANGIFGPDGRRTAFVVKHGGKQSVVVDGEESRPYESATPPLLSPDGKHVAFVAEEAKKYFIVVDGIEMPRYTAIIRGRLSFDATNRLCAIALRGRRFVSLCIRLEAR